MIHSQEIHDRDIKNAVNFRIGDNPSILNCIHDNEVNIAIYERDISAFANELTHLLDEHVEFKSSGTIESIVNDAREVMNPTKYPLLIRDISQLLLYFKEATEVNNFRLLLATVNTNMCRRFHTDVNDLRMLSTNSGPGTLWLTDDNINRVALNDCSDDVSMVIDESRIQQAATGAVVILKGAIYPQLETEAVVHRSPTIEESGEKRLLLRIDTNESLNLWR